ncbi:predicted protein [Uncinocarpus reesii 1704]|uniref:Uncharacterized protein n=1 Tax=Uncinocarpus reesii (strain UAMH 1704) TaxID=336963 RepID=C4JFD1_UNCRE|nr:uncharacterized protein UREG_00945 [Uncinocarpus reesii 1704]EEP76096.1 predicted protein [Uncinocarpus reesii 1704]
MSAKDARLHACLHAAWSRTREKKSISHDFEQHPWISSRFTKGMLSTSLN